MPVLFATGMAFMAHLLSTYTSLIKSKVTYNFLLAYIIVMEYFYGASTVFVCALHRD